MFHPTRKVRRFAGAFFMPEIAGNKLPANGESGVSSENHVGKLRLRRNQIDVAFQLRQGGVQVRPLFFRQRSFSASFAAHPRIDLVLDAVMVRRA